MRYEGYNGDFEVTSDAVIIYREGMVARAAFGKADPRRVPLTCISEVVLEEATRLKNGWVQIVLTDEVPVSLSSKNAASNPNTVLFTHKHKEVFNQLHAWLKGVAAHNHAHGLLTPVPDLSGIGESYLARIDQKLERVLLQVQEKQDGYRDKAAAVIAKEAGLDITGALFTCTSHDEGRNAVVVLYVDRIVRAKPRSLMSMSSANQDVEMTPVRSVSSVQAAKDGFKTKVTVYASGNNIEFRFSHDDARVFKDKLQQLLLAGPPPAATQPSATVPAVDVSEQLLRLAALLEKGLLTPEEFASQKAKLLAP